MKKRILNLFLTLALLISLAPTVFADNSSSNYFYKAVLWAVQKSITGGTSRTTFSPAAPFPMPSNILSKLQ